MMCLINWLKDDVGELFTMKKFNYNKKSINSSSESSLSEETTITVVEGSEESDSDYALPEKKTK